MDTYLAWLNAVALIGFVTGVVVAFRLPSASRGVKSLLIASGSLYAFIALSNILEHGFAYTRLDAVEDYMEILFIPMLVYTVYVLNLHAQYRRERRGAEFVKLQYELLLQIVDLNPVGTLVADDQGKITFASDGARRALELEEGADGFTAPPWRLLDADGTELTAKFGTFCTGGTKTDIRLVLAWPDGRRYDLLVSAAPMADRTGRVAACVVALEDIQTRIAALSS